MTQGTSQREGFRYVDHVPGTCMVVKRSVFEAVGGFDEGYFFQVEDTDFCAEVRSRGLPVVIDECTSIVHFGGASRPNLNWEDDRFLHESRIRYAKKHFGGIASWIAVVVIRGGIVLRRIARRIVRIEHRVRR